VKFDAPQVLLMKLANRLRLLVGGPRDLPERQRTMRGTIAWSYELLDEDEKRVFERLAVFAGGCALEAAEAVCRAGQEPETEVSEIVVSLIDKSLLQMWNQSGKQTRLRMLEVVREFAFERLRESGHEQEVERRHAEVYLACWEAAQAEFRSAAAAEWLERFEAEHDNLRTALAWLHEHDSERCLRLAVAARGFWEVHGHLIEGRRWLDAALERSRTVPSVKGAQVLRSAGLIAMRQGDLCAARAYFEESLRISKVIGNGVRIAWASLGLGAVAMSEGDLRAARAYFEDSLALGKEVEDDRVVSNSLNALGAVAHLTGDLAAARALLEQALATSPQIRDQDNRGLTLCNLGAVLYEEGDLPRARGGCKKNCVIPGSVESVRIRRPSATSGSS
jgi:tetratricopeptide (TPR) repeat protein